MQRKRFYNRYRQINSIEKISVHSLPFSKRSIENKYERKKIKIQIFILHTSYVTVSVLGQTKFTLVIKTDSNCANDSD